MKWTGIAIGAFALAFALTPWFVARARRSPALGRIQLPCSVASSVTAGSSNVQSPALQPEGRVLLPSARLELVEALRGLPPERFTVVTGTDDDSHDVGLAIYEDLKRAGWTPVSTERLDAGPPGMVADARRPQRRGVTAYMKKPSATTDRFLEWLPSAGLQPTLPGVIVQEDWPENVRIEVGDPP